ncbi:MAG: 3-hydroxyacyl-ACP dehydratase FabZ [Nitrospinae bacterium]|nr:3-hydroxyacyl-ACP dehydratase FabZ [Nitrospinota bacterium]
MIIEHHELYQYIPHRHPFLLIDRIVEIEPFKRVVAIKNVTGGEYFFPGHFPGKPVMPGVLIVEAMAQAAAALATYSSPDDRGKIIYFAAIDGARFKRMVIPGDTIRIEIEVEKARSRLWKVKARATVEGETACEADLTAMVADSK